LKRNRTNGKQQNAPVQSLHSASVSITGMQDFRHTNAFTRERSPSKYPMSNVNFCLIVLTLNPTCQVFNILSSFAIRRIDLQITREGMILKFGRPNTDLPIITCIRKTTKGVCQPEYPLLKK
jgi:hypothetical protein